MAAAPPYFSDDADDASQPLPRDATRRALLRLMP